MRDYGTVSPHFWIGTTGKALRGDVEAQLVALYLMTSPHANMIGVYYCPLDYIAKETGLPLEGASKALARLSEGEFCSVDGGTEEVFVTRMAAYQIGEQLQPKDKRCIGIARELEKVASSKLQQRFRAIYSVAFHLPKVGGKLSPSKAPSKAETETGAETGTSIPPSRRKTTLPDGFTISDRVKAWAKEKGYGNLDPHFDALVSYAKRKGATYVDWDEALMTAVRDDWGKVNGKGGADPYGLKDAL